jgi:hypothetical protein
MEEERWAGTLTHCNPHQNTGHDTDLGGGV